ncbi:L-rhamnose mutarotase [Sphingomonas piscis]|uniref:L-rhamnose mutarotase n=1 Tax=Sphingomonas piscis TaxID=2714943 RepID=UPI0024844E31|nr:L-rhamnose mutarotase [Sphingomonas piscis]
MCFALDLDEDPDLIAQYRRWHRAGGVPEGVIRAIRQAGIDAMEIWLTGNRLFMVMEVAEGFDLAAKTQADASDPDVRAWEELMWRFQRPLPWAEPGEKWVAAERIFDLGQQPGK